MDFDNMTAKEIFFSEDVQRSWRIHSVTFRPFLEEVFIEDYTALILLTAALNKISRREIAEGIEKLDSLEHFCVSDTDRAAICFFHGVACDMQSETEKADSWYQKATELYSGYYWPFARLAKSAHKAERFAEAEEHYIAAIRTFDSVGSNIQFAVMLSSLYCNYASCLMSMERFAEAETALHCSEKILPQATNREELWQALRALTGKETSEAITSETKQEEAKNDNLVVDTYMRICKKCNYGDAIELLSRYERVFYVAQELEGEVNNGGFSQFFFNSSGNFSGELVQVFSEIGAHKVAAICQRALDAFGCSLPTDRFEREELLDSLDWDNINPILEQCDSDFYEYPDDLNALNYAYIQKHKKYFI